MSLLSVSSDFEWLDGDIAVQLSPSACGWCRDRCSCRQSHRPRIWSRCWRRSRCCSFPLPFLPPPHHLTVSIASFWRISSFSGADSKSSISASDPARGDPLSGYGHVSNSDSRSSGRIGKCIQQTCPSLVRSHWWILGWSLSKVYRDASGNWTGPLGLRRWAWGPLRWSPASCSC